MNQKSPQPKHLKQILSNLICFTLYTMQSCNLLILFSALNISFKTSALPLQFHPHYILLRLWPYAFDNGLLPSDAPRFVFPQDSEDLLPRSDHPVKHQMFQKKGSTNTHRTWWCSADVVIGRHHGCDPRYTISHVIPRIPKYQNAQTKGTYCDYSHTHIHTLLRTQQYFLAWLVAGLNETKRIRSMQ